MKIAVYPGSFNPFHEGHESIVRQLLPLFDKVIIARGFNRDKANEYRLVNIGSLKEAPKVEVKYFTCLLKDFIEEVKADCIIKGLRNGQDFEYEKSQQYWNEDLGINIPTLYIIADRNLTHISSSAIKQINKIKGL